MLVDQADSENEGMACTELMHMFTHAHGYDGYVCHDRRIFTLIPRYVTTSAGKGAENEEGVCLAKDETVACEDYMCTDGEGDCCPPDHCKYVCVPCMMVCRTDMRCCPHHTPHGILCLGTCGGFGHTTRHTVFFV